MFHVCLLLVVLGKAVTANIDLNNDFYGKQRAAKLNSSRRKKDGLKAPFNTYVRRIFVFAVKNRFFNFRFCVVLI